MTPPATAHSPPPGRLLGAAAALCSLAVLSACAALPRVVPASELPSLQQQVAASPDDPDLSRLLAASLVEVGRCDGATVVAGRFQTTTNRAWPLLVRGRCLEAAGSAQTAEWAYLEYLADAPNGAGAPAVRGQLLLVQERIAVERVRGMQTATLPEPSEEVVAVLPVEVRGPEAYRSLDRGLAAQISADLLLLDRFTLVSRTSMQAVVDELELAGSPLVDSTASVRFGRVVQAGQLVDGVAEFPDDDNVSLTSTVVRPTGEVASTTPQSGSIDDLLTLQKELVFEIAARLGYVVSEAERQRILQNGTRSLTAFLAYSSGLELADRGDYAGAARQFAAAYRLDPGFGEAREALDASVGADAMSQGAGGDGIAAADGEITRNAEDAATGVDAVAAALTVSLSDVAPTQGEQATGGQADDGSTGIAAEGVVTIIQPPTPPGLFPGLVRIVVIIPGGIR